jgi:tRNA(fMet)-specific endonuclease VapC
LIAFFWTPQSWWIICGGKSPSITQRLKEAGTLYLPLTALGELLFGAYNSAFQDKGLKQIEDFLRICAVLDPDERTAHIYGRIKADLSHKGNPIPQNDVWIAAVALEHHLPLATRDPHFTQVTGLTLLQW